MKSTDTLIEGWKINREGWDDIGDPGTGCVEGDSGLDVSEGWGGNT